MSATGPDLVHSPSGSSSGESHEAYGAQAADNEDQCTDYSSVFPGNWSDQYASTLLDAGWASRTDDEIMSDQSYVPPWTRPNWNPAIEISFDGEKQRVVRGDAQNFMRPTILPIDKDIPRTDYTKRWGINTAFPKTASGEARSGLTPTAAADDPPAPRQWTHEESWQSYWFYGFTTQETTGSGLDFKGLTTSQSKLIDTGVYARDAEIQASDLPTSDLHRLFSRDRWEQPEDGEGLGGGNQKLRNFDMKYSISGTTGRYDGELNDFLWEALQPSLRLASNIINSAHPVWAMFVRGIYHMRKVPMEIDGRTDREKADEGYRPYRALWLEIDEDKMYDNARALYRLGFDAGMATMAILLGGLKWSFYETEPHTNGSTTTDQDGSVHIFLNANIVWPLLTDEYTEGEKVAMRLKITSTILHEMCHACHQAHYLMMEYPGAIFEIYDEYIPGLRVSEDIKQHLLQLRDEAVGPRGSSRNLNGRQYFIEDDVSYEEGKAADNRIWGALPDIFPPFGPSSLFKPMVLTRSWPYTHPKVYLQNEESVKAGKYTDYTTEPYKTWLLYPNAGVYDLHTPIPVSNYSHLFQFSWWAYDFQRYGHQAIQISSTRSDQSPPMQSVVSFRYTFFGEIFWPLVGNHAVYKFLFMTAPKILRAQNQHLLLSWLTSISCEIAVGKIMRLRLHYEKKTWDDKYEKIIDLCQEIAQDFKTTNAKLKSLSTGAPASTVNQVISELNVLLRTDLPELYKLVDLESRYTQSIAAEYFLKNVDDRHLVRRSMHTLLGHLVRTVDEVSLLLLVMLDVWSDMGTSAVFTAEVEDCEAMYSLLTGSQTAISGVIEILKGNTLDQRTGPGGHGPLAAVPIAQRELRQGTSLRIAAMREFAKIPDMNLKRLVQTWLNILHFCTDIRHNDPDAEDWVVGGGTIAELRRGADQAAADAMGITFLDRQDQVEENRAQGIEPGPEEEQVITELQEEMARFETASDIIDLYSTSFSEEEQARLKKSPKKSP